MDYQNILNDLQQQKKRAMLSYVNNEHPPEFGDPGLGFSDYTGHWGGKIVCLEKRIDMLKKIISYMKNN